MSNPITYNAALEIAYHEAIVRQAYKDSVGVWTWSVGLTNATGHNVERYKDNPQTMEHCLEVFVWALENKYAPAVRKAFAGTPLTEAQFAAALSFHWNTGSISKASWVDLFKQGKMKEAEASFKAWNKAGGKVSQGLVNRREMEADLLFRGRWANDGTVLEYPRLTSSYTPVWASGKRVDIKDALTSALGGAPAPEEPAPDADTPAVKRTPAEILAEIQAHRNDIQDLHDELAAAVG